MGTYTTNPNAKGHIWPLDHVMVCPDRYSPNMRRINEVHLAMYRSQHPSYDRLSGIGPGAGQRRTRPSPDANGLARAYPQQRIETSTRPPAVGSGDYVANPRFGIQRTHRRTVDYLALAQGPGGAEPATALMPTA